MADANALKECAACGIEKCGNDYSKTQWAKTRGRCQDCVRQKVFVPAAPRLSSRSNDLAAWRGCVCGGGAYGDMVACDGGCDNWFHFACVGLARAPRGEYICDACGAGFGFRRSYDDDDEDNRAIACLQENPKKPGTACNLRYEAYKSATTVAEFLEKGGTPADLTHDVGKGFVWYLDADDGRRPRGNQLLPSLQKTCASFNVDASRRRARNVDATRRRARKTKLGPSGIDTLVSESQV